MGLMEISEKRTISREDAASLLREIADSLARHNELEFMREGKKIRIDVPHQVDVELELEIESDGASLEIEISW